MTNSQKFKSWNYFLIFCQIIQLTLAFAFIYQQNFLPAVTLLVLSGNIALRNNQNSVIKFLNKIIWSLLVVVAVYLLYVKFFIS